MGVVPSGVVGMLALLPPEVPSSGFAPLKRWSSTSISTFMLVEGSRMTVFCGTMATEEAPEEACLAMTERDRGCVGSEICSPPPAAASATAVDCCWCCS